MLAQYGIAITSTEPRVAETIPEKRLWRAVICQAIMDRLHLNDAADRWLYNPSDIADASAFLFHSREFVDICRSIDLSPDSVRERLKKVEAVIGTGLLSRHKKHIDELLSYIMGDMSPVKRGETNHAKRPKRNRRVVD